MKKAWLLRLILGLLPLLAPVTAHAAGGWTATVAPEKVEVVRTTGFMIFGPFGNPGSNLCTNPDGIWVAQTHPQYRELLSTALSAVAGGLKLQAYVHNCTNMGWHGGTYNELTGDGALFVSK